MFVNSFFAFFKNFFDFFKFAIAFLQLICYNDINIKIVGDKYDNW